MKFSLVVALTLAGLTVTAAAQQHQKPKAKPSYTESKQTGKGSARAVKDPAARTSTAQELRRVEQSSARAAASRKTTGNKATRSNPALKAQKESNPPIHFASAGGGHGTKSKSGDPTKGRLRHKGSHK